MYSDQVTAGAKRSIRDRLQGNFDDDYGRSRSTNAYGKRQRPNDDKWKHDLYEDAAPHLSKPKVSTQDLRLKLQKKGKQEANQGLKSSGVRDLREKLSGTMTSLPSSNDMKKGKPRVQLEEVARAVKKNIPTAEEPVAEAKKSTCAAPSKKSQKKDESTVHGLLQSLGLEKYSITFQAEEVDMAALMHMTDDDLKALGIPMGPRKKILLALESKA